MSLQWGIVAGFLYVEIGILGILLLPGISPLRWQKLFRSRFLHSLGSQTQLYFYGLLGLLCLLFLDAIREMRKYSGEEYDLNVNPKAEMQAHMKLFRAQRNFYISGFALLLTLVIRRIATLISVQGTLMAQSEAALKQATSASAAAQKLMKDSSSTKTEKDGKTEKFQTEINTLKEELEHAIKDRDTMKIQAKSVSDAYDHLVGEHEKLEKKLRTLQKNNGSGDGKDD